MIEFAASSSPAKMNYAEALQSSTIAEMEETIARISSHKGVEGVMIMDRQGDTIPVLFFAFAC